MYKFKPNNASFELNNFKVFHNQLFIFISYVCITQQMQNATHIWLKNIVEWKDLIFHLIYPEMCSICSNELTRFEKNYCSVCFSHFKFTAFENYTEASSLDKLFWGRGVLNSTFALLYFEEGSDTRKILHAIKYQSKQDLAEGMGELIGQKMSLNPEKYNPIQVYIPVPLHPKKKYRRGYNQSELLANGISKVTRIPVDLACLTRVQHAKSQTTMGRFLRWDNIEEAFQVGEEIKKYQHIALVDDVVTTGSTLESCMQQLLKVHPDLQISIISLAIAK